MAGTKKSGNIRKKNGKANSKKTELKLPDIDAVFDTFQAVETLLTATYEVMAKLDKKKNWIPLLLLEKGRDAFERLGKQLDEVDDTLVPFRQRFKTRTTASGE